jgi:hypothetical protein
MATKRQGGTSRSYIVGRLERERPDLAERLFAGEFRSARAAAREAGWVVEKAPIELLRSAWNKVAPKDQHAFLCQILECSPAELAEFEARNENPPRTKKERKRGLAKYLY